MEASMKAMKYLILLVSLISINYYPQQFPIEWELPINIIRYLGDIDNDGVGEFLNQGPNRTIHSGIDGSIKYTYPPNTYLSYRPILLEFNTHQCDLDYNNNGVKDLYMQDDDGNNSIAIIMDPLTNEIIFAYTLNYQSPVSFLYVGDFDNDNIIELCIEDYDSDWQSAKAVVFSTGVSISSIENGDKYLPKNFYLYQNYPNPFNPSTIIEYEVNQPALIELNIFDTLGSLIRVLVNQEQDKGKHKVIWDGKDERGKQVSTGVYFYELKVDETLNAKKMLFIK
jgi:hypothetical protein